MTKLSVFVLIMGIVNFFLGYAVLNLIFKPADLNWTLYTTIMGVTYVLNIIYTKVRDSFIYNYIK
jgi:hypothetical protein